MRVDTRNSMAAEFVPIWLADYRRWQDPDRHEIAKKIEALTIDEHTADRLDQIFGGYHWLSLRCDECGSKVNAVVHMGDEGREPYFSDRWLDLCADCLRNALDKLSKET